MSYKIFKYPLQVTGEQTIKLPYPAHIQSLGEQEGQLVAWAVVDDKREADNEVDFLIVGTGHELPDQLPNHIQFTDTVQMSNGLVWHVYSGLRE